MGGVTSGGRKARTRVILRSPKATKNLALESERRPAVADGRYRKTAVPYRAGFDRRYSRARLDSPGRFRYFARLTGRLNVTQSY